MTTVPVSREERAEQLLGRVTEWLPVQAHDGRSGAAIPSQRTPGLFHLTDGFSCSCGDFVYRRRLCKHLLAAQRLVAEAQA
jgi:hypothetical protein